MGIVGWSLLLVLVAILSFFQALTDWHFWIVIISICGLLYRWVRRQEKADVRAVALRQHRIEEFRAQRQSLSEQQEIERKHYCEAHLARYKEVKARQLQERQKVSGDSDPCLTTDYPFGEGRYFSYGGARGYVYESPAHQRLRQKHRQEISDLNAEYTKEGKQLWETHTGQCRSLQDGAPDSFEARWVEVPRRAKY